MQIIKSWFSRQNQMIYSGVPNPVKYRLNVRLDDCKILFSYHILTGTPQLPHFIHCHIPPSKTIVAPGCTLWYCRWSDGQAHNPALHSIPLWQGWFHSACAIGTICGWLGIIMSDAPISCRKNALNCSRWLFLRIAAIVQNKISLAYIKRRQCGWQSMGAFWLIKHSFNTIADGIRPHRG